MYGAMRYAIVAGVLLALFLPMAQSSTEPLVLTPLRSVYAIGDTIEISVKNNSDDVALIPHVPRCFFYHVPWPEHPTHGRRVFPEGLPVAPLVLEPGDSVVTAWDQVSYSGAPASVGIYYAETYCVFGETGPGEYFRAYFEIRESTPTHPTSWGQIKALWRE